MGIGHDYDFAFFIYESVIIRPSFFIIKYFTIG